VTASQGVDAPVRLGGYVAVAEQVVLRVTLDDLRCGGPAHTARLLSSLRGGRTAVVDAVCDDDLRVLALALAHAEENGTRLLYRVGPSFVRARAGQAARAPLTPAELRPPRGDAPHGLIVVGSEIGLTGVTDLDLDHERVWAVGAARITARYCPLDDPWNREALRLRAEYVQQQPGTDRPQTLTTNGTAPAYRLQASICTTFGEVVRASGIAPKGRSATPRDVFSWLAAKIHAEAGQIAEVALRGARCAVAQAAHDAPGRDRQPLDCGRCTASVGHPVDVWGLRRSGSTRYGRISNTFAHTSPPS
jgi:hypothetical protein